MEPRGYSAADQHALRGRAGSIAARRAQTAGFTLLELVIVVGIVGILAAAVLPLARWSVKRQKEFELQANLRIVRNAIDRYHDLAVAGLIEVDPGDTGFPPGLQVLVDGVEITGELPSPIPGVSDEYAASGAGLTGGLSGRMESQGFDAPGVADGGQGSRSGLGGSRSGLAGFGADLGGSRSGSGLGLGGNRSGSGMGLGAQQGGRPRSGLGLADARVGGRIGDQRPGARRGASGVDKLVLLRRLPVDPFTGSTDWGLRCYGDSIADRSWCGRNVFDVYSKALGTGMDGRPYREW